MGIDEIVLANQAIQVWKDWGWGLRLWFGVGVAVEVYGYGPDLEPLTIHPRPPSIWIWTLALGP